MKVVILSESPADRAALHIFVNSLLGQTTELHDRRVPVSGWTGVFDILPAAIKELHFNAHDVDGLVAVVDSDLTTVHHPDHVTASGGHPDCRLCRLLAEAHRIQRGLSATSPSRSNSRSVWRSLASKLGFAVAMTKPSPRRNGRGHFAKGSSRTTASVSSEQSMEPTGPPGICNESEWWRKRLGLLPTSLC